MTIAAIITGLPGCISITDAAFAAALFCALFLLNK